MTTVTNRENPSTPIAPPTAVNGPRSTSCTRSQRGQVVTAAPMAATEVTSG